MKKIYLLLLSLFCATSFAQIKGTIQDSTNKEPIPYVNIWVEGEENGTTADEIGNFTLPSGTDTTKRLLLNAVGYAPVYVKISEINSIIYLDPKPVEIDEVIITNKTGEHMLVVNPLKKIKKIKNSGHGGVSRMFARYVPYKPEYNATPYIDKLRFPVQENQKPFTFNLRLYSVNDKGEPGEPIYDKNILVTIPPKKKEIIIDLSRLNIRMPEEGLFVVVERFLIPQNISGTVYRKVIDDNGNLLPPEKLEYMYDIFGPNFICEQTATSEYGWNYDKGKWKNSYHYQIASPPEKTHMHGIFAVEITLTD